MKVVEPYAKMLSDLPLLTEFCNGEGIHKLRRVEYYARVSHASEDKQTENSYDRFLRSVVLQHGDWSVTKHEKVTCEFLVDRGITHEIVRHRIGSYTQESTRFVNYQKRGGEAKFVTPPELSIEFDRSYRDKTGEDSLFESWNTAVTWAEKSYMDMVNAGVKPQIARSVFPNALASKIIVTYNLRSWRHFFIMRTSTEAHPQMRQVVDPLLAAFQANIPILYEDIVPGERQAEAMKKAR